MKTEPQASRLRRIPLKRGLDLTILSMGLFTIALILVTGEVYRQLAVDSQQQTLASVIAVESDQAIQTLGEKSRQLGLDIQQHPDIHTALQNHTGQQILSLADQFNRFFVTAGVLKLEAVWLLDPDFNTIGFASRHAHNPRNAPQCPQLLDDARKRVGHSRLQAISRLCVYRGQSMYAQILPVGLRPDGYVIVVTDPARNLVDIESHLQLPLTLYLPDKSILYRSSDWVENTAPRASLEGTHKLIGKRGEVVFDIHVQGNFQPFYSRLSQLQRMIIALTVLATLLTMLVARYVTRKIILEPLHRLSSQLRRIGTGRRLSDFSEQKLVAVHEFAELQELYSSLHEMALTDPLTQLPNRLHLEQRLGHLVAASCTNNETHALCYLDLDQFKIVNDSCGHAAGDLLLQQLAGVFREHIRSVDLFARIGGDEFALLLEHCPANDALRIADQLREAVENFRFFWQGRCFTIGVSIGLVPIHASSENASRIMSLADASCYIAKQQGRNRVHVYSETDSRVEAYDSGIRWAARLQQALAHNNFRLFCQPVVGCARQQVQVEFFEILVWLQDESGELIAPGKFLPAAERYSLIARIDRWVVTHTLDWLKNHTGPDTGTVYSINLSASALTDNEFLDFVVERINASGIAPAQLAFEITETGAASDFNQALRFISTLRDMGCRFVLDDFGTGLSSFTCLQRLAVDYIKIDGQFVQQLLRSDIDLRVLDAMVQIGRSLHITTIAECVESELIFRKLKTLGVDLAQGFYLEPPHPLERQRQNTPASSANCSE